MPALGMTFVMSGDDVDSLPHSEAEIAIVGRSNVGKSSLVNALSGRRKLAHVSNTPGRTRLLNLFTVDGGGSIMDLPGYGYAKAPKHMRDQWGIMIESYLLEREGLTMVMVLVDGEVGPTKLDLQMLEWLRANGLPHTIIATKHDKVKSSKRDKQKKIVADKVGLEPRDIVWVSAHKGVGIDRLRGLILHWLEL